MRLCRNSLPFPPYPFPLTLYPLPFPHEKYSYFDFAQHAAQRRPRRHQALDEKRRNPGVAKLHSATLQFQQRHAAVQVAEQQPNQASPNLLHFLRK